MCDGTCEENGPYELTVDILANLLASDASGFEDAVPTEDDYKLAEKLRKQIDERY